MKPFLFLALSGISFFSFISFTHATAPVEIASQETEEAIESDDYTREIIYLEQLHAMQIKVRNLKKRYQEEEQEKLQVDLINQKYNSMEACNINLLSDVYEDPKTAWKNITQEYDDRELKLTVDILNSIPQQKNTGKKAQTELFANWYLGKEVLTDVYANPEKYGKLKEGKSFDLWEDQKYVYADEVNSFLQDVNKILGRTGRINGITAENNFAQNESAYKTFLSSLPPDQLQKLSETQKTFPKPPKALPPAHEIMWFTEDPAKSKSVFPQWPQPWQKFIQSGFNTYNENGEMAKTFLPKSLVLNEEMRHMGTSQQNNRLNVYQAIKKEKTSAENTLNVTSNAKSSAVNELNSRLKDLGIQTAIEADNIESVSRLEEELLQLKSKNIQSVRDKITKKHSDIVDTKNKPDSFKTYLKMSYIEQLNALDSLEKDSEEYRQLKHIMYSSQAYQDFNYVNALEKDINGSVNFTVINAQEIDHLLKEKQAENALYEELEKKNKEDIKKAYNTKINKRCLEGGL